jgi:hypothetical protein
MGLSSREAEAEAFLLAELASGPKTAIGIAATGGEADAYKLWHRGLRRASQ